MLTNLGVAFNGLGQRAKALDYYRQARDFYAQMGDERRAAEQEVNAANLTIISGPAGDHGEALRRLEAAQATLKKLGAVEFDVFAMQVKGVNSLYQGQPVEATRQLRAALNVAKERHLTGKIAALNVKLAEVAFSADDYEGARTLLEQLVSSEAGRDFLSPLIGLARIYGRYGDFSTARTHLARATRTIESSHQMELAPIAYMAAGEVSYEAGDLETARGQFAKAASLWSDDLPDAASVEAKCYEGLLDALAGKAAQGRDMLDAGIAQAHTMGRAVLEARCRLNLARVEVSSHRSARALSLLGEIQQAGPSVLGKELEAEAHYWRGRALADQGNPPRHRNILRQERSSSRSGRRSPKRTGALSASAPTSG